MKYKNCTMPCILVRKYTSFLQTCYLNLKKSIALCIFVDAPSNRIRECPQIIPTLTLFYTPLTTTALVEASSQLLTPSALWHTAVFRVVLTFNKAHLLREILFSTNLRLHFTCFHWCCFVLLLCELWVLYLCWPPPCVLWFSPNIKVHWWL